MERRTFLKGAAWSLPVIAVAASVPLASASVIQPERIPIRCEYLGNHGHGGDTGNGWRQVYYSDNTSETLDNGTVMSDPDLRVLCKKKGTP